MRMAESLIFRRCPVGSSQKNIKKAGDFVVELDQFKTTLNTFRDPLQEVRDSL